MEEWYRVHPESHCTDRGATDRLAKSLGLVRRLKPTSVIDVGSGAGDVAATIRDQTGAKVVCFDISAEAVEKCRARGLEAHVVSIGQSPLPISDASVDVALMAEVIEHVVNPDAALTEVHRVLAPSGHLVLSTPNMACLINRLIVPLGLQPFHTEVSTKLVIGRRFSQLGEGGSPVGHLRIATYGALRQLLQLNGFRVVRAEGATVLSRPAFRTIESIFGRAPSLASILVILAAKA